MTDAPTCARCEREMRHDTALVCGRCGSHLRADLHRTAGLEDDVQTTIAKLDRVARGPAKPDPDPWESHGMALEAVPLPVNLDAAEAYEAAMGELSTWARHCCEERGIDYAGNGLAALCGFLAGQVDWLRYRPEADEAFSGIRSACRQVERLVDTRPDVWYAGPCSEADCQGELYPLSGAASVACPECGAAYDTADRKRWLLEEAQEAWGNAAWLSAALTMLGVRCTDSMIRGYAHRGRLAPHPEPDGRGYRRYRLGSVLELVTADMAGRQSGARRKVPA